jgi:hypothetical protein
MTRSYTNLVFRRFNKARHRQGSAFSKFAYLLFFLFSRRSICPPSFYAFYAQTPINFLDVNVYKGKRFKNYATLDLKTYFKPTNSFMYLHRELSQSACIYQLNCLQIALCFSNCQCLTRHCFIFLIHGLYLAESTKGISFVYFLLFLF